MKTLLNFFFLISLLINAFYSNAQSEKIDTLLIKERYIGQGNFPSIASSSSFKPDDEAKNKYIGIPQGMDTFQLSFKPFDTQQYHYDRFKKGLISEDDLMKRLVSPTDTLALSKTIIKHRVGIFTGLKGKDKLVIVDANNNYNFSDDKILQFDTAYYANKNSYKILDSLPMVEMKYEMFTGVNVQTGTNNFKIAAYDSHFSYQNDMDRKLDVFYLNNDYNLGKLNINDKYFGFEIDTRKNTLVLPLDSMKSKYLKKDNFTYQINEKFTANGSIFSVFKISRLRDTLFLKNWGKGDVVEGNKLGMLSRPFCKKSIEDSLVCLEKLRGKYVLIDFWGTWCKPCIASIPDVKKIRDAFSTNDLEIISLAADNDLEKVKAFVKQRDMNWIHLQQALNSKDLDALTVLFNVNLFPTTILIDRNGLIIEKGSGTEFVESLYGKLKVVLK